MIFVEAREEWDRDAAWAAAHRYAEVCRTRPECRLWKVTARQMELGGKYGRRRIWAVYAGQAGDQSAPMARSAEKA